MPSVEFKRMSSLTFRDALNGWGAVQCVAERAHQTLQAFSARTQKIIKSILKAKAQRKRNGTRSVRRMVVEIWGDVWVAVW